jgi:uncharacterized protein YegP (UPF0339 family)
MKFKVLKNSAGNWYWHLKGANGQIVATAGESFSSKDSAKRAAENVKANTGSAGIATED